MNLDYICREDKNSIWRLSKNQDFHYLEESELTIDRLVELYFQGAGIIYVVRAGRLTGLITGNEIILSLKNRKPVYNTAFTRIVTGEREYSEALDIMYKKSQIHNIPVVDKDGYILYEFKQAFSSAEALGKFYEELKISSGINTTEKRDKKIIVSLTSYGHRLETVHLGIKSMMTQTVKADKIILYVEKESAGFIPDKLRALQENGLTIVDNVENLRTHKKYYYAMKEYPEDIIITIDDDVMYEDTLIESLYESYKEHPLAVSYRRTHRMTQKDGRIEPYNTWISEEVNLLEPSFSLLGTGVGGGLYPPGCLDEQVLNIELCKKLAFYQDDLWLKYMQLLHGTKSKYVRGKFRNHVTIPGSQGQSCTRINVEGGWNDVCIEKLSRHFSLDLADFCEHP